MKHKAAGQTLADPPSKPHDRAGGQHASIVRATSSGAPEPPEAPSRARAFAEPLISGETLETGENALAHADATAHILKSMGGSATMQAATYLAYCCTHLNRPEEVIAKAFGSSLATLAVEATRLEALQRQARKSSTSSAQAESSAVQTEAVRKMLLAFSRDLRVVMLRMASRLQTLRHLAAAKMEPPPGLAHESLTVFAPLANRLGIWQIKWEMEDLAFRFLEPEVYKHTARLIDQKRVEREASMQAMRAALERELNQAGIAALVQGRPKHIYSIVKKMRGKSLGFEQVLDLRALRVIAADAPGCYGALGFVHARFIPMAGEFDDYIARPKSNGYQSLHTVVSDDSGRPVEIQIRTQAMHEHAEHGVAAHWAYKEAGTKGYAGVSASNDYDAKIAVLRQLLAWERDLSGPATEQARQADRGLFEDRIYVLTPDAAIVELPQGATAVDFAYTLHTSLGHRCRGARLDGVMVPLNTPLQNGQSVEIIAAKEGGPSRDWLNPDLGFLTSHRAKSKVRAWFNGLASEQTVAKGREAVEKLLQREGKTALKLADLAMQLGFKQAEDLFAVVGKDELSLRTIENMLRPAEPMPVAELEQDLFKKLRKAESPDAPGKSGKGSVLVVGIDSLLTQLARCCKPAPPDRIRGFVTRGKGVSIHRGDCSNFRNMASGSPDRVIDVQWNSARPSDAPMYPVDIAVEAGDRQGLLRDISEVFSREKVNVIGVQTQSVKDGLGGTAWMTFTVEVAQSGRLRQVLLAVQEVAGVRSARRR